MSGLSYLNKGLSGTEADLSGYVSGPNSSTDSNIATFSGPTGKIIQDSGKQFSTDGTFAANSDALVPTQKATKTYVDMIAAGFTFEVTCYAATTANLNATYVNGIAGVGATLTNAGALAAFSVDGQSPSLNARILVKNQSTSAENGIYTLTTVGSGAIAWVLTRSTDYDTPAEITQGGLVPVTAGTLNANSIWLQTATVAAVGTDAITFTVFSSPSNVSITGGAINGTTIGAITPSTGAFTQLDVDNIRIDGNTISSTDTNGNISLTPNGTGAVVVTGQVNITGSVPSIEVGAGVTGNQNAFIDLIGDTTYSDYGLRIIRQNTGPNTASVIIHRGTGEFSLQTQDAGAITFYTNNTLRATINAAGNLVLTGALFSADFSNATRGNRLNFQTSTTNSSTGVGAIPNGTATTSAFVTYGGSDPDNAAYAQFHATDSSHVGINSSKTGTGTTQPIDLQIDNVTGFRLQTDGNTSATNGSLIGTGLVVGFSGTPVADQIQVGNANFMINAASSTLPNIQFDSSDLLRYNRTSNTLSFFINSVEIWNTTSTAFAVDTNVLYVDTANNNIGINNSSPLSNVGGGGSGYPVGWNGYHLKATNGLGIIEGTTEARLHFANSGGAANSRNLVMSYSTANKLSFSSLVDSLASKVSNILVIDGDNGRVGVNNASPAYALDVTGDANVTGVYRVDGTQVVSNQGAAVADATGGATVDTEARSAINALLARLRVHGLIAT